MLTTSCPKCEKEVTVPGGATATSRVRCPLCSEEYTLESVFSDLPPLLVLLDAPATNGAASADTEAAKSEEKSKGMFDFGQNDTTESNEDGGEIGLAEPEEVAPKSSGFDFGSESAPAATTVASGKAVRTSARPRKKQGSPVKMIVGVVIGGLLAGPIAQLILWWLPGKWEITQHDPLGIARDYPGSLGLLAPKWIRNYDEGGADPSSGEESPDDTSSRPADNGRANLDDSSTNTSFGRDLNDVLRPDGDGNQADDNGNSSGGSGNQGGGNSSAGQRNNTKGVVDPPSFTSEELAMEIVAGNDALVLLDAAVDESLEGSRLDRAKEFLEVANQLAKVTTFVDQRTADDGRKLKNFLAKAGESKEKRRFINTLSRRRVDDPQHHKQGIIISGTVDEIAQRGQLWETVIKVNVSDDPTKNPPLSIFGSGDPSSFYGQGDTVIFLGAIVDNPKQNLRGTKASEDAVVWGGNFHIIVDTEE